MFNILSCISPKAEKNGVLIRFENKTKIEFDGIRLGTQLPKKNSYRTYDCATNYSSLKSGELSNYQETRGKFYGYNRILLLADKSYFPFGKLVIGSRLHKEFGKEFATYATEKQELTNKLNGEILNGLGFPVGKYTYVVVTNDKGEPSINIIKD